MSSQGHSSPGVILIVEDDPDLAERMGSALHEEGSETARAATGAAGLAWLAGHTAALVLLDDVLPDMTGLQFLERAGRPLPFLVTTRTGDERAAVDLMEHGARDYLVKDARFLDSLRLAVRRVLKQIETERQLARAEAVARAASAYTRSLIEVSLDPLVTIGVNGRITDANEASVQATGVPRARLIGTDFPSFFTEPERAREGYRRVFSEGAIHDYPLAIRHVSGRVTDVLYNASVYRDDQGHVLGVFAAARDITERKRAEEALRASEERYRSLFENSLLAISQALPDGRLLAVNAAYVRMYGYASPAEILAEVSHVGRQLYADPEDREDVVRTLAEKGEMEPREFDVVRRDGTRFVVMVGARAIRDAKGELLCYQAVHQDITARRRAEVEMRASREQMRALAARLQAVREEERTRVAREIHDVLAQELTRLKIDLVWLQGRLARPGKAAAVKALVPRVAEMAEIADTAIQSVQRIATKLRPAVLDSLGLCAAVEWQARDFQDHAGILCRADVPAAEPPVDRDVATAAFRILQESLTNVQRHAHATLVAVSLRQEGGQLVLRIQDNGCGIAAEALSSPMSIGLAGMRERALLLGGRCEVRSPPGAGTTIDVRLPLAAQRGTHAGPGPEGSSNQTGR